MNLKNCWILGLLVLGVCLLSPPLNSHADDEKDKRKSAPPATIQVINAQTNAYTLAAGTTFVSSLETLLTTQYNQPNDAFSLRLIHDVWVNNQKILPKGTRIEGYVEESLVPIQGRDAILKLKAHTLHTLDDHTLALQATLFTSRDDAGLSGGKVTQPMNGRLVRYEIMGIGMINRVMPEGPRAMGEHQRLNPGQLIRIRLDAPLTVIHSPYEESL